MQNDNIAKIIKQAKERDPDAFTKLMQFYMKDMYRDAIAILMNDEDAADAIQDTVLVCWEKLHTLKKNRFFKTWMTRILINNCYAILRRREHFLEEETYAEPAAADEYNLELKEALSLLDDKYRMPMVMFYGQGYKIREIAELLQMPCSTVQTRLARGREQLVKYFEADKE